MGLDALIRTAYRVAHSATASLQVTVLHQRWRGKDGYGKPKYADALERTAIVEPTRRFIRGANGQDLQARATVTFLAPLDDLNVGLAVPGRQNPTDPRDVITLPDGTTCPILDIVSMTDPTTERPYAETVILG